MDQSIRGRQHNTNQRRKHRRRNQIKHNQEKTKRSLYDHIHYNDMGGYGQRVHEPIKKKLQESTKNMI